MSDDEPDDDPFEAPDSDAVDDPFAALGEGVDDEVDGGDGIDSDVDDRGDVADLDDAPDDSGLDRSTDPSDRAAPAPSATDEDPFAELDADAGDAAGETDPFESMSVGDVGEEDVWEALDEEADADAADAGRAADEAARSAASAGAGEAGEEHVIDKRSYCQQCPHFTAPPETACTHEGTAIVESVDFSQFRVRNCPMIDADDPAFDDA